MNDNHKTPSWILKIFEDWFDPCPLNPEPDFDGLEVDWKEKTFVNPPYSNPMPWVEKAIKENQESYCTVIMLLKMDSSTKWFAKLVEAKAEFLWFSRRLKFNDGKGSPDFASMLVILKGGRLLKRNR